MQRTRYKHKSTKGAFILCIGVPYLPHAASLISCKTRWSRILRQLPTFQDCAEKNWNPTRSYSLGYYLESLARRRAYSVETNQLQVWSAAHSSSNRLSHTCFRTQLKARVETFRDAEVDFQAVVLLYSLMLPGLRISYFGRACSNKCIYYTSLFTFPVNSAASKSPETGNA